jgi:hypothetical protein
MHVHFFYWSSDATTPEFFSSPFSSLDFEVSGMVNTSTLCFYIIPNIACRLSLNISTLTDLRGLDKHNDYPVSHRYLLHPTHVAFYHC